MTGVMTLPVRVSRTGPAPAPEVAAAMRQIETEYREMPGLKLTLDQAKRLWSLDHATCTAALRALMTRGFLRRTSRATYVRADEPVEAISFSCHRCGSPVRATREARRFPRDSSPGHDRHGSA